jgi:hypothetical protein
VNNHKWRKWFKFVLPILSNNNYGFPVLTIVTKSPNQFFLLSLVDLQTICAKYGLETCFVQMMIFVDISSPWIMVEQKTHFEERISANDVNSVSLFQLPYLITLMDYLRSQWKSNVQIKFFMFDWSIYRLFVLNRGWKRENLQIMIYLFFSWHEA